ncbi:MAG: DUF4157 domain-containing protein [Bacteroidales bacterium]|nr:DUF4157 domain-containing protein [Bacteroidales bacterium]
MKATATQTKAAANSHARNPFFSKGQGEGFFTQSAVAEPAFFGDMPVQAKLSIGKPGDKYEQEADSVADKVVQKLSMPESPGMLPGQEPKVQTKPGISTLQPKCSTCGTEEKMQPKEEDAEIQSKESDIQKKPIFESQEKSMQDNTLQTRLNTPSIQTQANASPEIQEEDPEAQEKEIGIDKKPVLGSADPPDDIAQPYLQRKCETCAEEDKQVQRKANGAQSPATPSIESRLASSRGKGSPLPKETQSEMGSAIGADFSNVRVHTGSDSVQLNKELGAQAFTHGTDVYFGAGKYNTGSKEGKHLLAHELTHTVQQGGAGRAGVTQTKIQRWPAWADSAASWVGDQASGLVEGVVDGAEWVGGQIADGAQWVGNQVSSGIDWVGEQISSAAQWVVEQIRSLIDSGTEWLTDKWKALKSLENRASTTSTAGLVV